MDEELAPTPALTGRWDEALAPPNSRWEALPHGSTRYQEGGPSSGPLVLLIHGMTYPMEVWTPLFEDLVAAGFRVVRYDLYGRGFSSYDGRPLTLQALAEQALTLLERLEIKGPVHAISLSNSDLLASALAARLRSLIWIAPSGFDRRTMNWRVRLTGGLPLVKRWAGPALRRRCRRRMEEHQSHLPADASASIREFYELSIRSVSASPHFPSAVISHMRHLPRDPSVLESLRALAKVPLLMIEFGNEADATDEGLEPFKAAVPHAEQFLIREGSHMGLLEEREQVSARVLQFLSAQPV